MLRVALTGNVASGKSAVADVWQRLGATIVDADVLARRAVEPGTDALNRIEQQFGSRVIRQGALDRAALRAVVFRDAELRRTLEDIVHPEVERLRLEEERSAAARGERVVVHAIPLLFETGLDRLFDVIVLVDAPAQTRRDRITRTRGLSAAEADAMIAAQMPSEDKRARADYVIDNDGSLRELKAAAGRVWAEIMARVS